MELVQNVIVSNLLNDREVRITWNVSTTGGITGYKVYRSTIPYDSFSLIATIANPATVEYTDTPNLIPINEWYYYVIEYTGANLGTAPSLGITSLNYTAFESTPFTDQGQTYPTNTDMKFYFEEIRRRNLWLLQNDGESMSLLQRKFEGTKCPLVESEYEQCPYPLGRPVGTNACYGTTWADGYYSKYTIKVRRINASRQITPDASGLRLDMGPRMWTVWSPRLREGDFFVDNMNKRWEIRVINNYHWRGLITHQEMDVDLKGPGEMLYRVPV